MEELMKVRMSLDLISNGRGPFDVQLKASNKIPDGTERSLNNPADPNQQRLWTSVQVHM
jgi:hypothetical protein